MDDRKRVSEGMTPMVGEGIAPMLVEEEVLVEEPDAKEPPRAANAPGRRDGGEHE